MYSGQFGHPDSKLLSRCLVRILRRRGRRICPGIGRGALCKFTGLWFDAGVRNLLEWPYCASRAGIQLQTVRAVGCKLASTARVGRIRMHEVADGLSDHDRKMVAEGVSYEQDRILFNESSAPASLQICFRPFMSPDSDHRPIDNKGATLGGQAPCVYAA